MLAIHSKTSCPICNSYDLERVHRSPWMKIIFKSKLFKCQGCNGYFFNWSFFCTEMTKFINPKFNF